MISRFCDLKNFNVKISICGIRKEMSWSELESLKSKNFKVLFILQIFLKMKKVCIIGGGPAGIMVAGALKSRVRKFWSQALMGNNNSHAVGLVNPF